MPLLQPKTLRFSVTTGVTIGVIGTLFGFGLLFLPSYLSNIYLQLLLFLGSFALLTYFSHCLAHFVVGEILGIKFSHYVLGGSSMTGTKSQIIRRLDALLPRLGIRLTRQSRENATHTQRVLLFSSGVITSTLLPLISVALSYLRLASPLNLILPLLWFAYAVSGVYLSPKYGDLSRIKPAF